MVAIRDTHQISREAECISPGCGWTHGGSFDTKSLARQHATLSGHDVVVKVKETLRYVGGRR